MQSTPVRTSEKALTQGNTPNNALAPFKPTDTASACDFPDGGRKAWLAVLGGHLALFAAVGVMNSFGVFREYYAQDLLSNSSPSTISLIGSMQLFFMYALSPITGRIFDAYGSRVLVLLGSFLTVISLVLTSFSQKHQPLQFLLWHGVLYGIGCSLLLPPSLAVVGHWFLRKRACAMSIVTCGSSLGGVFFPIILKYAISELGFAWALRLVALIVAGCLAITCLTLRTRLPLSKDIQVTNMVDLHGFRDPKYVFAAIGAFFNFYGLFIPFFYIEAYADLHAVPIDVSKYQLTIMNASGTLARLVFGLSADKYGPLKVLVPSTMISGLLVFGLLISEPLWLPKNPVSSISVFSASYGFFSAALISLLPPYVASFTPMGKFGARLGSMWILISAACLAGNPTASILLRKGDQKDFDNLLLFSGSLVLAGGVLVGLGGCFQPREVEVTGQGQAKKEMTTV